MRIDTIRWAEENFVYDDTGPAPGEKFRIESGLFLRDVFEGFDDPSVREGACRCSAQSGKTQTGVVLAAGSMEQDPGPFMWVLPAKDEVETFAQTRLMESFERIRRLSYRLPKGRSGKKKTEIAFPGAPLILVGAHSGSKLSGKPIRNLFLDEEKDYPKGASEKAIKRVRAKWNAKIWRMSTPREKGQNIDAAFLAGDQRHFHIHCPACGDIGPMVWENLKWNEHEREDDLFNSIRYECPSEGCGKVWQDNPADRADLIGDGKRWIAHNPNAPRNRRSWTWNAMLPDWNRWAELVAEFRGALAAKRLGNDGPMEIFETETLGKPLEPKDESDPVTLFKGDYKKSDYELGQLLEGEKCRGMFIDRQLGHFWAVIRAFRKDGSSLLLWEGKIDDTRKIEEYRDRYKVIPRCTFMDSRFQPQVVCALCARMGYTAMLGSAESHWRHPSKVAGQKGPLRPYSPLDPVYVGNTSCFRITFSNLGVKDVLANLRAGKGAAWEIPADTSANYDKQIDSEVKRITVSKVTKEKSERWMPRSAGYPNHLWDCEVMGTAFALSQKLLDGSAIVAPEVASPALAASKTDEETTQRRSVDREP